MSFPRYPTYKNTVTDWLGEVPEHWSVNRFKLSVESCTNGVWGEEASNDENDVTCIRVADFDRHRLEARDPDEPTIRNVSDRDIEQRSLRKGDLLIEKSGGGEKQPVGAVVLYIGTPPAVCSNFVARMRLKRGQSPSFWRYAHHAAYSLRVNTKSIKQTSGIQNLDQQQYLDESAAYPSLDEQLAIGNFLDRETAKIDTLIAEQQRLIELLQEKRQAVISHAVTKGLNPDAPMKDSGVEWLGEVPEHWELSRVKAISSFTTSGPRGWSEQISEDGALFVQSGDLNNYLGVDFEDCKRVRVSGDAEALRTRLQRGDAVVCITGAKTGNAAVCQELPEDSYINQHLCLIRPRNNIEPGFLGLLLKSHCGQTHFALAQYGLKQGLSLENVRETPLVLPPMKEQVEIVSYVNKVRGFMRSLINESHHSVEILKERRSALISAAVTGQIDVRGLVEAEVGEQ